MQSSSAGGYPEFPDKQEKALRSFEAKYYRPTTENDQLQIDHLIGTGFAWEEAITLLNMREHLYENSEMRQRMADNLRIQFVRWMYAHGELSDN